MYLNDSRGTIGINRHISEREQKVQKNTYVYIEI